MKFAVMAPAQRDRELIADLAPECPALREAQVVGIRGLSAANQARLLGNEFDMVPVTNTARLRQRQRALVDRIRSSLLLLLLSQTMTPRSRRHCGLHGLSLGNAFSLGGKARKSRLEAFLDALGVCCG